MTREPVKEIEDCTHEGRLAGAGAGEGEGEECWREKCRSYSYPDAEHFCGLGPGHSGDHYCPCCRRFWARSLAFPPQAGDPS